jgi:hypothetical protein
VIAVIQIFWTCCLFNALAIIMLLDCIQNNISILSNRDVKIELAKAKRLLSEPQIFIEE